MEFGKLVLIKALQSDFLRYSSQIVFDLTPLVRSRRSQKFSTAIEVEEAKTGRLMSGRPGTTLVTCH
mgnify:CR=1 FL=1